MKTFEKKEKSDCSASDDSPPQRPKRNTCQKSLGVTNGLLWREETDLKKALYASLQENKRRNWEEDGEENPDDEEQNQSSEGVVENGKEESPKKAKVHAQRKFAQGSTPNSPVLTPQKVPPVNNSSTQLLPYRRPKTEDFLTFLCLRGTSILPPSLDFLNCSKSDTSSEGRSLSPELEEYCAKDLIPKSTDSREKSNVRQEGLENGLTRKMGACKASSKRYLDASIPAKKTSLAKSNKEAVSAKKRKIRDENEDPSNSRVSSSSKSKSFGLSALREKYKKQRLEADKKKLLPAKSSTTTTSDPKKRSASQKSQNDNKSPILSPKNVSQKRQANKQACSSLVQKGKISQLQKKLAVEKRKSLRSADMRPKRLATLKKKTPWLRKAKLVPPIVDVESDSSEPEVIHSTPPKKASISAASLKKTSKSDNICDRLRNKQDTPKVKSRLTSRQMLLRKHMQSRLKAKKCILHTKSIKSRTIVKRTTNQAILKKVRKNLVMKTTMSLRKDLQNKRVTRSAKHQIEEMFWSNPEKKKLQNQKTVVSSKSEKKKPNESQSAIPKKQKANLVAKDKESVKVSNFKDNLKRKSHSVTLADSKNIKQTSSKTSEAPSSAAKISRRSLSREDKPGPSNITKTISSHQKSIEEMCSAVVEVKPLIQNDGNSSKIASNNKEQKTIGLNQENSGSASKNSKCLETLKSNLNKEPSKVCSKSDEKNIKLEPKENKNDLSNFSNSSTLRNDKNVQNNLNLLEPDKTSNKDISNLIELNVNCEEPFYQESDPCCSSSTQVIKEKGANKTKELKTDSNREDIVNQEHKLHKKNHDKKSLKKNTTKEESKALKRHSEKEKSSKKDKSDVKSIKKHNSKERKLSKDTEGSLDSKKSSHKKEAKIKTENVDQSEVKKNKSNHDKKNSYKTDKTSYLDSYDKNGEKSHKKDNFGDKSPTSKTVKQSNEDNQSFSFKDMQLSIDKTLVDDVFASKNCENSTCATNSSKKPNYNILQASSNKDQPMYSSSSSATNRDTDDDSDYDLTLDQFIKLKALKALNKCGKNTVKEDILKNSASKSKELKVTNKEAEKDVKSKKDGEVTKHKKDKDSSKSKNHDKEQKVPKKEDKGSKKDPKSLAKLLKKEREKEKSKAKKEEKSKHKKDGSSKSSKKDSDKDGSKSSKKDLCDKDCSKSSKKDSSDSVALSVLGHSGVEHSEGKKEKTKKEPKISRSSSCEETKSPKKKKKHNEFKDIEKIKNLISKSSILSEFSGFKEFKRRSSSDKSELKKSKKRKKLALLKEKKLSKKLSSKLLRKYSKKKGLKSKKKLKKKELKDMKIGDLESKLLKSKKQKHKVKSDHHGKDSSEKAKNIESFVSVTTSKTINSSTTEAAQLFTESLPASNSHTTANIIYKSQTCCSSTSTVPTYIVESVPETVPSVETQISQPAAEQQYVISSSDGIVTSDLFEESLATGAILVATRDTISQVPVHFIQDIPAPKTMADAATNTGEDDIEDHIDENLKSDEMSVGTQTMTPVGSPSPTIEIPPTVISQLPEKIEVKSPVPSISVEITSIKTEPVVLPTKPILSNVSNITTTQSGVSDITAITPTKPNLSYVTAVTPIQSFTSNSTTTTPIKSTIANISNDTAVTPSKSVVSNVANSTASTSPKPKRRSSLVKKSKAQSFLLAEGQPFPLDCAKMVSAPVYHPTVEEFRDPLEYIFKIQDEAAQFGICKIVPPPSFKPECKVNDDMRFTAHNQYLHKMLHRWGPNVKHTACIKKHLKSQKVKLEQAPLIGGIELDISRFYHTVQQYGGLQQVIEKKKWQRVADALRVPKTAQDRVTKLYDAYCKYLVSYDTLPKEEKEKLEKDVIADHEKHLKFQNSSKDLEKELEDYEDEENTECVSKGRSMSLSNFFRIARNTMSMWFKNDPSPQEVEHEYWKVVTESQQHVVVHAGNIDSSVYQSGFACNRNSPFAKHPWNLKILTNNTSSILRCMGPVSGVTIPTLHVGMLFTTGCWYRDPHSLPWIEYLHTGASKIWYSIPAKGCEKFRGSMKRIMPEHCTKYPIWLPSDTAMVPPELLVKHGASLSRTIQNSGQFVVIFPESFTSTICCGYCVSESVYFAPTSWLDSAVKAFEDIQSSNEPPSFSLERLLFSIANDSKTQPETLQKILPLIQNIRLKDMHLRSQLAELGLNQWERLPVLGVKDKKKKSRIDDEWEQECEICRTHCYVSMVANAPEDTIYCLPHALDQIPRKNLKSCKLMYTYNEKELQDLERKISEQITTHVTKLNAKKKSPKKKLTVPAAEK